MINNSILKAVIAGTLCFLCTACTSEGKTMQNNDNETTATPESTYYPGTTGEQSAMSGTYQYDVKEIWLTSRGNQIYGKAYIPETNQKTPLVIFAHELGVTHTTGEGYAEYFASRGIAYYVFDFPGGSISGSKSDGDSTDMSILTEAEDLKNVLEQSKSWDFIDGSRIYLHGGSQGGMVAAITASMIPDEVAGLILAYPAFIIPDQLHSDFSSLDAVPDTFTYIDWIKVGKIYAEDAWNYDTYNEIQKYTGPVLIMHGDADTTVPMSYSQRAASVYQNAELKVISGGGHEFFGNAFDEACQTMESYFQKVGVLQ